MATPTTFERQWPAVLLSPITVANNIITVSSTAGLHTHATVVLSKPGETTQEFIVNKIYSDTQLSVAVSKATFPVRANPTQFNGGTLAMPEQNRNPIQSEYVMRAVYAEEPTVALRTVQVDRWGQFYTTDNPMPVQLSDGAINIGTVNAELEVQLSHLDNYPNTGDVHDSVRIGGRDNGPELVVNPDGSINAAILSVPEPLKISGTQDGTPTGTEFTFVNNRRLQILAALDRQQAITTADFGTKDQRITQIDYTAPSIGTGLGYTARKVISYTLVGTRYRRDSINWVLI